jgi:hypothetical protein
MQLVWRTFCKSIKELRPCVNLLPKVASTNVLEWRTPEDRHEKTRSSWIDIPQLGRGDNDVQSPQLMGSMIESARDGLWSKLGRNRAQKGPGRSGQPPSGGELRPPFFGVKKTQP